MDVKTGQVIKLDTEREYIIAKTLKCNNITYLYLISLTKPVEVLLAKKIVEEDGSYVEIIIDKEEKEYILSRFANEN